MPRCNVVAESEALVAEGLAMKRTVEPNVKKKNG
jgi:hypothetical protein